jgi:hypothetical protein
VALVVLIAVWEFAIRALKIPNFILPTPGSVVKSLHTGYVQGLYWPHFFFTFQSMVLGYAAGCVAAFLLGCLFAESRAVDGHHVERLLELHAPGIHERAEHVGREPGALLVGEHRDRDGTLGPMLTVELHISGVIQNHAAGVEK